MLSEIYIDEHPARRRRSQARLAGHFAALWTQRIAAELDLPEQFSATLQSAARHITSRHVRGARLGISPIVSQYQNPSRGDWAVGVLRVAEAFALAAMDEEQSATETLRFMRQNRDFYPTTVVTALAMAINAPIPETTDELRKAAIREGFLFLVASADREEREELAAEQLQYARA